MRTAPANIIIRDARDTDADAMELMLDQLGYPGTSAFIREKITMFNMREDARLLLAELDGKSVGLISIHFIPQLALRGDFARISYFVVEAASRNKGVGNAIGKQLEALARARGCDRIEVHCHARRTEAHRFYLELGYTESPVYFIKKLN